VTSPAAGGQSIDDAAASAFAAEYADRARNLPPVAIVIAAYNEEGTIGPVVEALPGSICGLATATIVVVDGSADGTASEARASGALVCDVPVNRGQGAALRLGYRLARGGGASFIVTTDADGQYDPAEAEYLLGPVVAGDADFVTGSRTLGSEETKDPVRKLGVRLFAGTISVLTGQRVTDPSFGMRAMRAEVTAAVDLQQPQYQAAELLIGVIARGFRVAERPATIRRRRVGESKKGHNAIYALRFARVVVGTWWRERRQHAADASGHLSSAPTAHAESYAPASLEGAADDGDRAAAADGLACGGLATAAGSSPDGRPAPAECRSAKRT
jgi:Glycosyl transferase family 2